MNIIVLKPCPKCRCKRVGPSRNASVDSQQTTYGIQITCGQCGHAGPTRMKVLYAGKEWNKEKRR